MNYIVVTYYRDGTEQAQSCGASKERAQVDDPHGARCNVIDMLTDLRHLCDAKGWDFADLDRQAYQHYRTEKEAGGLVA